MNVRKIFLIIACLFSGVSVFVPLYFLQLNGETVEDGAVSLMPSYYGIAILVTAVLIIGFAVVGLKKGYIITSLINVGLSLYATFNAMINKESAAAIVKVTGRFISVLDSSKTYNYTVVDGPGSFLLIFSAILVLVTMFWNLANRED